MHKEIGADMVGELIDGRFRILRRLARGGMADVFLAKDPTRKCHVAIKLLRTTSPDALRRFAVEAEVLSNIHHEHIVRAIAFGETLDRQPYMALEYLDGEPLSRRLAQGPLPWRQVVEIGIQISSAAHALHLAGIVHRDIKPDNIVLTLSTDRAVAKLIDLGLASVGAPFHDAQDARFSPVPQPRHKTQLGHPIGTPDYLPPEAGQCDADPKLDVYALGATLHELCTGQRIRDTGGRPIHDIHPTSDAPADLSRLLAAALAPDPDARLPSADHLRRGLEAILAAHPLTQHPQHLFGGSYDRLDVLGVGASAVVFQASDRWLSRDVAIKVLRDASPSDDDTIRFRRAAKILSALHHPNIPRILHFGVHDGQMFAVTELCTGVPATDLVRSTKHLRPDEVLALGLQLADALAAVHAVGVIYRDLHPGNVLIARGDAPRAWLFDFDHAHVSPAFYARLTERWATPPEERLEPAREKPLRTVDYVAPEVRAGAPHTPASDTFSLGLLLYRLLTGQRPFPPSGGEPTPPRKYSPACPTGLARLLIDMLSADPNDRPSLAAVRTALADEQAELDAEHDDVDPPRTAAPTSLPAAVETAPAPSAAEQPSAAPENPLPAPPPTAQPTAAPEKPTAPLPPLEHPAATAPENPAATAPTPTTSADTPQPTPTAPPNTAPAAAPVSPVHQARSSRILLALALLTTAAISAAIGRATVPAPPPASTSPPVTNTATEKSIPPLEDPFEPAPHTPPPAEPSTPTPPPAVAQPEKHPDRPPRPVRRTPVTAEEATAAAARILPALRTCGGAPNILTVDLDITRGRGTVTALNLHALATEDPRYAWHACVQPHLERLRFPVSDTAGHTRIRLTLR